MVAPGDNLDFQALPNFSRQAKRVKGLGARIVDLLRVQPHLGHEIATAIHQADLDYGQRTYRVFYGRHRNSIGLIGIFDLDADQAGAKAMEEDLKRRHKKLS